MADESLIPDDLLRQIIGVGQVDLLVGLPTHELGDGVAEAVEAVRGCFRRHFPRLRTALLNVDRGSADGTSLAVQQCWDAVGPVTVGASGLRTTHCMTTSMAAWADGDASTRCILAAGDLLQAGAIVVLDADVDGLTPGWVAALAATVGDRQLDLVAPAYRRHAADGPLVTQLVRPLMRAIYGRALAEPLLAEFGCSGRLAAACTRAAWDASPAQRTTNVWVAGEALSGGFTIAQAEMGTRRLRPGRLKRSLADVFRQVVGSTFATIDAHDGYWTTVHGTADVPTIGAGPTDASEPPPVPDGTHLLESFAHDVTAIDEVLRDILAAPTLAAVQDGSRHDPPRFAASTWAATVAQFLVAYHGRAMNRDHITQALLPLYAARAGVFLLEHGHDGAEALEAANEHVCLAFEEVRVDIKERWLLPA